MNFKVYGGMSSTATDDNGNWKFSIFCCCSKYSSIKQIIILTLVAVCARRITKRIYAIMSADDSRTVRKNYFFFNLKQQLMYKKLFNGYADKA